MVKNADDTADLRDTHRHTHYCRVHHPHHLAEDEAVRKLREHVTPAQGGGWVGGGWTKCEIIVHTKEETKDNDWNVPPTRETER